MDNNPFKQHQANSIWKQLTPGERNIVLYHRKNMTSGNVGKDSDGRPVTVYSNTIQIPDGPFKGKFTTVPGYFDGKTSDDENELWSKWGSEVNNGQWPLYINPQIGDERAKFLHQIMDIDYSE